MGPEDAYKMHHDITDSNPIPSDMSIYKRNVGCTSSIALHSDLSTQPIGTAFSSGVDQKREPR
jgi:hypothetical protein